MGRPTLQTIADRVGVSRMTVSNAFNRPDQLSGALRERIMSAADELGYSGPDPAARTLARGRSGTVALVTRGTLTYAFTDAVAVDFLGGIAEELEIGGLALTVAPGGPTGADRVSRVVMDGAIGVCLPTDADMVALLRRRGVPVVLVDSRPVRGWDAVNVHDRQGAQAAARHVIGLGHRHVALVTIELGGDLRIASLRSRSSNPVVTERLAGWRSVLDVPGVRTTVISSPVNGRTHGYAAGALGLDGRDAPTAFLCLSDVLALGVIDAAVERGLRVPHDISVVGFDDGPLTGSVTPPLTTVAQPVRDKGRLAGRILVGRLSGDRGAGQRHVLATELVVRGSTGPPPSTRGV